MLINFIFLCILNLVEYSLAKKSRGTIVGGVISGAHDFPYTAFMAVHCETTNLYKQFEFWVCGSSILNQRTLLTAAHCIYCKKIEILVKVGHANKNEGISKSTLDSKVHEDYNDEELYNDIGVIILSSDMELGPNVRRVVLMKNPPPADIATVAGWGLSDENYHHTEEVLRYISQNIVNDKTCLNVLKSKPKGTMCANNAIKLGHASLGDSGGALVVRDYIQIGLVSYRVPSIQMSLTVYTSVPYYIGWIRQTMHTIICKIALPK